ncbi:MAG: prepilin-type N-terminal cleavage/methylation domain-containing protein [Planctomycetota bacterium]|nr:prepilin-type N-terminal cleavage/methylation domain-containing protein [Planctomycetota bacterium]
MNSQHNCQQADINRKGFTLVELLVVMSIMIIFGAMTVAFYPSVSSDNELSRIANQVQGMIVGARQTARRELVATGIRFLPSTNPNVCEQLLLIQKPADIYGYTFGPIKYQAGQPRSDGINVDGITLNATSFVDPIKAFDSVNKPLEFQRNPLKYQQSILVVQFPYPVWSPSSEEELVKEGDLLVNLNELPPKACRILGKPNSAIFSNGLNTQISSDPYPRSWTDVFVPNNLALIDVGDYNPFQNGNLPVSPWLSYQPKNYRIIRNPRVIPGEKPIDLPANFEISLVTQSSFTVFPKAQTSTGEPAPVPVAVNLSKGFSGELDLVFDSNGAISSQSASSDVYLWLHRKDSEIGDFNQDAIICIRKKNGAVGIFPVNPLIYGTAANFYFDPFSFAKNPSYEGL